MRVPAVPSDFSFNPLTSAKAWLLGVIFGDGSMHPRQNSITICAGSDKEIAEKVCGVVGGTLEPKQERTMYRGKYHPYWNVYLNSVRIWREVHTMFGLTPDKSLTMKFPALPMDALSHFVRGLTDSDGCWDRSRKLPRWRYATGSIAFSEELRRILQHVLNITITEAHHDPRGGGGYSLECTGKKALAVGNWMYADSSPTTRCERKFNRWSEVAQWAPLTIEQMRQRRHEIAMQIPTAQRSDLARRAANALWAAKKSPTLAPA